MLKGCLVMSASLACGLAASFHNRKAEGDPFVKVGLHAAWHATKFLLHSCKAECDRLVKMGCTPHAT